MAKKKPRWQFGARGRYVLDETGSRCRDLETGRFADCKLCARCPIKRKAKRR